MRYTLLEMVQRILESMDSDEVNSYDDTIESSAVANIIKESYYYLVGRMDLPSTKTFFNLTSSGSSSKPVLMTLPTDVLDIEYVKYKHLDASTDSVWDEVQFVELEDFMQMQDDLRESTSNVSTMSFTLDGTSFEFKYYTDRNPLYYTTIDDYNIVFSSYDSTVDSTLQSSKTRCFGRKIPTFTMSDSFTPDLDPQQFQLLLNEAKAQAFVELKQTANAHADRRAHKMFINTQRTKRNIPKNIREISRVPNYGRRT